MEALRKCPPTAHFCSGHHLLLHEEALLYKCEPAPISKPTTTATTRSTALTERSSFLRVFVSFAFTTRPCQGKGKKMMSLLAYSLLLLDLATTPHALTKACLGGGGVPSLQVDFYQSSCPVAEEIIFSGVERALSSDLRMAASLLRLHFHDCIVNGCDASVLLDDTPTLVGEKTAGPNLNSLRGFGVIDDIKTDLEMACPGVVSCADILAAAARDSVVLSGGPTWEVELGRRDSKTVNKSLANTNIPGPNSDVTTLLTRFQNVGLSPRDMVALSGGHTIGNARCATFTSRLGGAIGGSSSDFPGTGGSGGDRTFLDSLQQLCSGGGGNSTLARLDLATPATFDNQYYVNLVSGFGLLASDQALVSGDDDDVGGVLGLVESYAADPSAFFEDFKTSMLNMGRLRPAVPGKGGSDGGEVRRNCRVVNNN